MAEKTIVEKAGEAVGFGIAMAEDVAGVVKTVVGAAVTTVTEVLKKAPATKTLKKPVNKTAGKKSTTKRATKKVATKNTPAKKAAKKTVKKAVRRRK